MFKSFFALRGKQRFFGWVILGLVLLLNVWIDYYHPRGVIFDVIIIAFLLNKWLDSESH
jgi:hypothetical protein